MKRAELWRSVKFLLFSCSAGLIELGSFALFNEVLHWPYWAAYLLALVLSVLWNFTCNRHYHSSFPSRKSSLRLGEAGLGTSRNAAHPFRNKNPLPLQMN